MNGQPAISVIIVNYTGLPHLRECLDSLRAQTFRDFETIFVDNASSDGSIEFVKNNFVELKVVRNEKNLGYGGGNNAGIRRAEGKYIVLLNNDTKVDPDWLGILFGAAEKDEGIGCARRRY